MTTVTITITTAIIATMTNKISLMSELKCFDAVFSRFPIRKQRRGRQDAIFLQSLQLKDCRGGLLFRV